MQKKGDRNSDLHNDTGQNKSAGIISVVHAPYRDPFNLLGHCRVDESG
jgi:hypothetical protein